MWSPGEVSLYCHVGGQKDYPVVFGQLTKRDGSFLFGRKDEKQTFDWSSLKGKKLIAGRTGGVPAMTLQYVLNQNGVTTTDPKLFDTSVAFNLTAPTFEGDKSYDYCTLFEPTATDLELGGKGYIVASVGKESGEVPYTAFTAKKSYVKKNTEKCEKFLKAVMKGYEFIKNSKSSDIALSLKPQFESTSLESIASAIESYLAIDAWCSSPVMEKSSFDRLQDIMENAGELSARVDFDKAVFNDIAKKLIK